MLLPDDFLSQYFHHLPRGVQVGHVSWNPVEKIVRARTVRPRIRLVATPTSAATEEPSVPSSGASTSRRHVHVRQHVYVRVIQKHAVARAFVPIIVARVPVVVSTPFSEKRGGGGRGKRTVRGPSDASRIEPFPAREKRERRCVSSNGILKHMFPNGERITTRSGTRGRERVVRRREKDLSDVIVDETKRKSRKSLSSVSRKDVDNTATHLRSFEATEARGFRTHVTSS